MANTEKVIRATEEMSKTESTESLRARIDNILNLNDPEKKLKALVSINLPGGYALHGIKLYESEKGFFIQMPQYSYKGYYGETKYEDIFHPVTQEARNCLIQTVTEAYEQALEQRQAIQQEKAPTEIGITFQK